MKQKTNQLVQQKEQGSAPSLSGGKKKWQQPRLAFVKPKLTRHGKLEEVTGQFFGAFTPPSS